MYPFHLSSIRCSGVFLRVFLPLGTMLLICAGYLAGQEPDRVPSMMPKPQQPAVAVPMQEYVISADDVLDVYIMDVPELSRAYRVSQTGQLAFPLLPQPLNAAGMTLDKFSALLTAQLKSTGTLTDPHVNVSVKESRNHSISITGA